MEIKRIVAFGCSITYGHGLPDCCINVTEAGPEPSKLAWPALVAKDLNVPVDNKGILGASNLEILYTLLQYPFAPGDIAVIMWSFASRDLLFGRKLPFRKQQLIPVGAWQTTSIARHWMMAHCNDDIAVRSWLYLHHASLFLKDKGVTFFNFFTEIRELSKVKPKFLELQYHDVLSKSLKLDIAPDKLHPWVESHRETAERILEVICKK